LIVITSSRFKLEFKGQVLLAINCDSVTLISTDENGGQILSDHASLLDGDSDFLVMPVSGTRLISIGPSTVVRNNVNHSASDLVIIGGVELDFTSGVIHLEHDTTGVAIGAVCPVRDDASIFIGVVGHPSVSVLMSVVDEGHLDVAVNRNRQGRNDVKRLSLLSLALASRGPELFDPAGRLVNAGRLPVASTPCDMSSSVALHVITVSVLQVSVSIAIHQVAISSWACTGIVRVANNRRRVALRYNCERDSLVMVLRETDIRLRRLTVMVASIGGAIDHGECLNLSVVRSLKPQIPSAVDPKGRSRCRAGVRNGGNHVGVKMIGDHTGIVSGSSPVVAIVMIVVIDCLVLIIALPDPHVCDSARLDDPGHSADWDDLGIESNIQMCARARRFNVLLEVRINLLVVISTVGGVVLTNGQSNMQIALVQTGVRRSVVEVVTDQATCEPTVIDVKMSPSYLLSLRVAK
jgi:hypothetical protein